MLLIVSFIPVTVVLGIVHLARRPTLKPPNLARWVWGAAGLVMPIYLNYWYLLGFGD